MGIAVLALACGVYLWLSDISLLATIVGIGLTIFGYLYVAIAQKIIVDGVMFMQEFEKKYMTIDDDELIISFKQNISDDEEES